MKYFVTDSACGSVEKIEADSAEEAAKIFCMGGDWGDGSETTWVMFTYIALTLILMMIRIARW
jgi:hypothetical protein